jgi:hypothetical protein
MPDTSFVVDTPSEVAIAGVAYAEANWGRWVARCVRPWCTNAIALEAGRAIEAILGMRPVRRTQNWLPGELLEDLLAENAEHGCLPPEMLTAAPGERPILLRTADQVAVGGLLHQQLEAAGRREIGA